MKNNFLTKEEWNYYIKNDYLLIPSEVLTKHEMCPNIFDNKSSVLSSYDK